MATLYQGVKIEITTRGENPIQEIISSINSIDSMIFKNSDNQTATKVSITNLNFKMAMYEPQHFEATISIDRKLKFDDVRKALVSATARIVFTKSNADETEVISSCLFIYKATPSYTNQNTTTVRLDIYSYDKLLELQEFSRVYTGARLGSNILCDVSMFDKPGYGLRVACNPRILSYQMPVYDENHIIQKDEKTGKELYSEHEIIQPYTVQYNETFRSMANRVANRCGEFLYWHFDALQYGLHKSNTLELADSQIESLAECSADSDDFKAFTINSGHRDGTTKVDKDSLDKAYINTKKKKKKNPDDPEDTNQYRSYENLVGNTDFSRPVNHVYGPRDAYGDLGKRAYGAVFGVTYYTDRKLNDDGNIEHDCGAENGDTTDLRLWGVGLLSKFVNASSGFINFITDAINDYMVEAPLGHLAKFKKIDIEKKKLNHKPLRKDDNREQTDIDNAEKAYPYFDDNEQSSSDGNYKRQDDYKDWGEWSEGIGHFSTVGKTAGSVSNKKFNGKDFIDEAIVLTDKFYTAIHDNGKKAADNAIDVALTVSCPMMEVGQIIKYNDKEYIVTKVDGEFTHGNTNHIQFSIHAIPVSKVGDAKNTYYLPEPLETQYRKMDGNSTAFITDVDDPFGQERVRVRFTWQETNSVKLDADEIRKCHEDALKIVYGDEKTIVELQEAYEWDLKDGRCNHYSKYLADLTRDIKNGNTKVGTTGNSTNSDEYLVNFFKIKTSYGTHWYTWYAMNWLPEKEKTNVSKATCKLSGFKNCHILTEVTDTDTKPEEIKDHKVFVKQLENGIAIDSDAGMKIKVLESEKQTLLEEIEPLSAEREKIGGSTGHGGDIKILDDKEAKLNEKNEDLDMDIQDIEDGTYDFTSDAEYTELSNEITTLDNKNNALKESNETLSGQNKGYNSQLSALQSEWSSLNQTLAGKKRDLEDAEEDEIPGILEEIKECEDNIAINQSNQSSISEMINRNNGMIQQNNSDIKKNDATIEQKNILLEDRKKVISDSIQKTINDNNETINIISEERENLTNKYNELVSKIEEKNKRVEEIKLIIDQWGTEKGIEFWSKLTDFSAIYRSYINITRYRDTYEKLIEEALREKQELINCADSTPWIRMATPMAGGGKMKMKPAVNTEVIVGFENGNVERPYVLGSLFQKGECSLTDYSNGKNGYGEYTPLSTGDYRILGANGQGINITDETIGWDDIISMAGLPILTTATQKMSTLFNYKTAFDDIDPKKQPKGFGGNVTIKDKYGFYNLTMSTANRKVSLTSALGTISFSAFQGISISAPNGDISINGKNVTIKAGDKLTLISGTNKNNLDSTTKDVAGAIGNLLAKMAVSCVTSIIGKKAVDLSNLRSVWEVVFKPLNGTMSLTSNRHLLIQAGKGKAQLPIDAMKAKDPANIVQIYPNYPYFLLKQFIYDYKNQVNAKQAALRSAYIALLNEFIRGVRQDIQFVDKEDRKDVDWSDFGEFTEESILKVSKKKMNHILQKGVIKSGDTWEVNMKNDVLFKYCPCPATYIREASTWARSVITIAQKVCDFANAFESATKPLKCLETVVSAINNIKKSKHLTNFNVDAKKFKAISDTLNKVIAYNINGQQVDFKFSDLIGSSANYDKYIIYNLFVGNASNKRIEYEVLRILEDAGLILCIDRGEALKKGKKRYKTSKIPEWKDAENLNGALKAAGPEGYRGDSVTINSQNYTYNWSDFINHCVPADSIESDSPILDSIANSAKNTVQSAIDDYVDATNINWILNQERNLWDTKSNPGMILFSEGEGKDTIKFDKTNSTIKVDPNYTLSSLLTDMGYEESTILMSEDETSAQDHRIFNNRWTQQNNLKDSNYTDHVIPAGAIKLNDA